MPDAIGADHARVADVDHVRRTHIESDAKTREEHRQREQQPHRPYRRTARRPVLARNPHTAGKRPHERRVRERHRREDVAVVEEPQRHGERHECEQVDRSKPDRLPPVDEAEQEDAAERKPQPGLVDLRAAEGAVDTPRHPPRDLRPGHASVTAPLASSTVPVATSPAAPDQTCTVHAPKLYDASVSGRGG